MSPNFSRKLRFFALFIILPLVVAKLLWSLSLFFLDKGVVENTKGESYGYHYNLNLSSKIIGNKNTIIKDEPIVADDDGEEIKNIKLKGTYLGGDASFMIIEDGGKSNFIYIGESYKGYEVVRISEKKVGLKKHGKNYYILLWDEEGKSSKTAPKSISHAEMPPAPIPGMPATITKEELHTYIKDPNKIWKSIRIQEQRENGQISGFRVNYVKKSSFFDQAGLRSGDVIKGIDGNEITSLADVMKYYTNVDSLDSLSLTVERAGEEIELDFNVN
jgi:general secretion pathway protein C